MIDQGLPRSYFHQRIAVGLRELMLQKSLDEPSEEVDLDRVDIYTGFNSEPIDTFYLDDHIGQYGVKNMRWGNPRTEATVIKVDLQQALDCLGSCPVCGERLGDDDEMTRSCSQHGDFVPTQVYGNGDVTFEFRMVNPNKEV